LALRNTDQINKFVLNAKTRKTETSKNFEAILESYSLNKSVQKRLELTYSSKISFLNENILFK
jgi:hypothetical protein